MADYIQGMPIPSTPMTGDLVGAMPMNPATASGSLNGQQPQQQAYQGPSITTSLISMWDANNNGIQLKIAALDSGLSIGLWVPFVGTDGKRTYPKEQRYTTVLSSKLTKGLERMIKDHIIPAHERGKDARYGIFTNNAHSTMFEIETRGGEFFATMYQGCDATTSRPSSTIRFKFEFVSYLGDYDPTTGMYEPIVDQVDFFLFVNALEGYNTLVGGMTAGHGARKTMAYDFARLMRYVQAIATAVHAQLPTSNYIPNGGQPNAAAANVYNTAAQMMQAPQTPTMANIGELTDLIG